MKKVCRAQEKFVLMNSLQHNYMEKKMEAWTIKQLAEAMNNDYAACHSDFERSMVKAICGKEIRETAIRFAAIRKLTPAELAIAEQYGYRA